MNPPNSKSDAKEIFTPANILKSVGASFPGAASAVEAKNQIEAGRLKQRITNAELQLSQLEADSLRPTEKLNDWSQPISEYVFRTVDIAIVYDGVWSSVDEAGKERILSFGHGCLTDKDEMITTTEVIKIAQELLNQRGGYISVTNGISWYKC